jgi:peptidoglycan hydrolase-like protein with peptidoglycan-binding domain
VRARLRHVGWRVPSYSDGLMVARHWKSVLAAVAVALLLSSCGGGGAPSASVTTTTQPGPIVPEMDSVVAGVEAVVSGLQLDLQRLGYEPGTISGQFTPSTHRALVAFQVKAGVAASERGALGPGTAGALEHRLGGSSESVKALQSALTDVGLYAGSINGRYGDSTSRAVKVLQTQSGLVVDGLYGPKTASALAALYRRLVPEPGAPTSPAMPDPSPALLKLGSTGSRVTALQQRLTTLGYRPGPEDGTFGASTASAVLAFQKREGLSRDGVAGPAVVARLADPTGAGVLPDGPVPRIEVDIARQIVFVVLPGQPVVTLNASSGNGATYSEPGGGSDVAYTPVGSFTVLRKIQGDEVAPLGTLHSPLYFYKGWAIHGSASVPAYPASHGCVRISNADADWLFPLIAVGTPVILYDTTGKSPGPDGLSPTAAPGY